MSNGADDGAGGEEEEPSGGILGAIESLRRSAEMQLAAFDSLARSLKAEAPANDVESPTATAEPERAALTDRESQVLTLVVRGCSNRQIARSLGISDHTVRTHLQSVFRKLEVSHRTEAAVVALREGLIDIDPLGP